MRLTPRKAEVDRVVEVLKSSEYDTPEAMAKAVLKLAGEVVAHRETWLVVDWPALFGPFASANDAEKAAAKMPQLGTSPVRALKVAPVAQFTQYYEGDTWTGCADPDCVHPKIEHLIDGNRRGKCAISDCPCRSYEERKAKK